MENVLELSAMPTCLNTELLKERIKRYLEPRITYYRAKNRAFFIEDEFSEYFTAEATRGQEIGGGSCGMDVKTSTNDGIDAMCVVMNKTASNEKSLIQNFSSSGANLDALFNEKKDKEAVDIYMRDYSRKLRDVKIEKELTDLYLLAFVSTLTEVYLVCFKINLDKVTNVVSGGFGSGGASCVNILVNGFIHPSLGNVKLYKSKKRMELRLSPDVLTNRHAVKLFTSS